MNISIDTLIRSGVLLIALMNQILTVFGINPLPLSEEEAYAALTNIATVVTALWAWWKNNSFTKEAIRADEYMKELKASE